MPNDLNAEACILSGVINQPDFILRLINEVEEEYFTYAPHKIIYRTMKKMFINSVEIDIITLADELKINGDLKTVGGFPFINDLSDVVRSASNATSWIKIVKERHILRTLSIAGKSIVSRCENQEESAENILDVCQKDILSISGEKEQPFKSVLEISLELIKHKEDVLTGKIERSKYYTGLEYLDRLVDITKGSLTIIGAKRSVGKSVLANTITFLNGRNRKSKCGIFNMEMKDSQLLDRELARSGNITLDKVIHPGYDDINILSKEISDIQDCEILVDDSSTQTLSSIMAKSMQMKHQLGGLDLIVVDYLQLMKPTSGDNREQQIASLSRGLQAVAKDLDIAVIALTQLNANGEARESKAIEQDCDIFIKIARPMFENNNQPLDIQVGKKEVEVTSGLYTIITIAKNRQGEVGLCEAWLNGKHQRFENYNDQMVES